MMRIFHLFLGQELTVRYLGFDGQKLSKDHPIKVNWVAAAAPPAPDYDARWDQGGVLKGGATSNVNTRPEYY